MELTKEELSVQTDRILEQYKLDLNCSLVVLNHITLAILDIESSIVPQIKEIVDFFNPSMLEWDIDYQDSYHERVIYCDVFLRSDQHAYASFILEGRYRPSDIITVKIFSKPNQKKFFEFEIDISSKHNRKMSRREIDIELDNIKSKIIEKIKFLPHEGAGL